MIQTTLTIDLKLPDSAKVWVYQANRKLTVDEKQMAHQQLSTFVQSWQSHGQALKADFTILYDYFIILGVDESMHGASGCSIDSSVKVIKEIEQSLGLTLLDKSQIAYTLSKEEVQIHTMDFRDVKRAILSSDIKKDTYIFNNQVTTFKELKASWLVEASQSWLGRFFS